MSLLGVDIGSSSVKASVFDYDGNVIQSAQSSYVPYIIGDGNRVELPADEFWKAFVEVVREISEMQGDIQALAISSHGETLIPVDKHGEEICNAIMNMDNRATWQAKRILKWEKEIYAVTGLPVQPLYPLVKAIWLRENEKEIYTSAEKFLSPPEYIVMKMGLGYCIDYTMACRTMGFNIAEKRWDDSILDLAEIDKKKFSEPVESGTILGRLPKEAASILGLSDRVVVAAGAHDQPCGALGSGAVLQGDIIDSAGTYECLTVVSDKPCNNEKARQYFTNSYCHCIKDKYITLGFFPAGIVSTWFVQQFCKDIKHNGDIYKFFEKEVEKICGPTGICITPHFTGSNNPEWDAQALGLIYGMTPSVTHAHMYKAVFEGIACELRKNLSALKDVVPEIEKYILINGGNSRQAFSIQLRADITGREFRVMKNSQSVCQGAALLAGKAIGLFNDITKTAKETVKIERYVYPGEYEKSYEQQIARYMNCFAAGKVIRDILN